MELDKEKRFTTSLAIVIRNEKIVWKLGPSYKILRTKLEFEWSSTVYKGSCKHGVGAGGILVSG